MKRRNSVLIGGAVVLALAATPVVSTWVNQGDQPEPAPTFTAGVPRGIVEEGFRVTRVVDGDTIHVTRNGQRTKVRLLGIDTPETVHPTEPVECFGPEASQFAKAQLDGRDVALEFDPNQPRLDQYGRTLAYVWVDGRMFNAAALSDGYAERYRADDRHPWAADFVLLESDARDRGRGLWGACPNAGM